MSYIGSDDEEEWNLQGIVDYSQANLLPEGDITIADLERKTSMK